MSEVSVPTVGVVYKFWLLHGGFVRGKYWGSTKVGDEYYYFINVQRGLRKGFGAGYNTKGFIRITTV